MTGAEQALPGVVGLRTRPGYQPDVDSLACSRVAAARERSGLPVPAFAAALHPLLGWLPSPSLVKAWESTVPPPGPVVVACEMLAARGDALALPTESGPSAAWPHDGRSGAGGWAADAAAMVAFRNADLQVGGGQLYARVVQYLRTRVAPRLVLSDPGDDEGAFTPAAAISEMAGWMAHDAGQDEVAGQHFRRAFDLISVGGDRQVRAHVLASMAHLAHHVGEPGRALRASRDGLAVLVPGPRDPDLEAHLLALEARGHAALGEPGEAVLCLDLAEKALEVRRGEPRSEWVSVFDEGALASDAARCMRQLGELGEARRQAERVIALRPPGRPRSRAFGMFVHANVLVAQGEPDEACAMAAEILEATNALSSHIVVQQLLELRRLLKPYRSTAAVREFFTVLTPALRKRLWLREGFTAPGPAMLLNSDGLT
jgi:hypothetical protein